MIWKSYLIFPYLVAIIIVAINTLQASYNYNPNNASEYCDAICNSINNDAEEEGIVDIGDDTDAYTLCHPYKFYPNINARNGSDCANFLSQCLIAGGLALPGNDCPAAPKGYIGGGQSGTTMSLAIDIDNFLVDMKNLGLVTKTKELTVDSQIPVDLAVGDVMIFYNSGGNFHATFVQGIGIALSDNSMI